MAAQILVVEDDTGIQELLALNLSRAGHSVRLAGDAEAAHALQSAQRLRRRHRRPALPPPTPPPPHPVTTTTSLRTAPLRTPAPRVAQTPLARAAH